MKKWNQTTEQIEASTATDALDVYCARLDELTESANESDVMAGAPLAADEAEILFDRGWTHGLEVAGRGFYLVEVKNTGWTITEDREEAMRCGEDF